MKNPTSELERRLIALTQYRGGPEKPDYYSSVTKVQDATYGKTLSIYVEDG